MGIIRSALYTVLISSHSRLNEHEQVTFAAYVKRATVVVLLVALPAKCKSKQSLFTLGVNKHCLYICIVQQNGDLGHVVQVQS